MSMRYQDESKPVFKSTPTQFRTTIFASAATHNVEDLSKTELTEYQQRILDLIKASPTISGRRMSEMLSVTSILVKKMTPLDDRQFA